MALGVLRVAEHLAREAVDVAARRVRLRERPAVDELAEEARGVSMDEKTAEARAALARAEARAADERAELAKGLKDDHERALSAARAERDAAVSQATQEAALERDASLRKAEARLTEINNGRLALLGLMAFVVMWSGFVVSARASAAAEAG